MNKNYIGNELELFAQAKNWSNYLTFLISPYLSGVVFEVGSGIGTRTLQLFNMAKVWVAVEPDIKLSEMLLKSISDNDPSKKIKIFHGVLKDLPSHDMADAILYLDVLEHIYDDRQELSFASAKLNKNGYLIILVPAHNFLYSDFDKAIGHFRRYSRNSLLKILPQDCEIASFRMLDSVGLAASLTNRFFLKSAMPSLRQILIWDRVMVKISRLLDKVFCFRVGKSILLVLKKNI